MLDALSSAHALERAQPPIAVLPIGSIEQHSYHLPLGTDWIAATALAHRVAAELGAYLLPALPVSMGRCHKPMAGTVWLRPMTLADAVSDVVRSVARSGIRSVVLINGHGGNFTLEVAVRELNAEPGAPIVLLPPMSPSSRRPGARSMRASRRRRCFWRSRPSSWATSGSTISRPSAGSSWTTR